MNVWFNDHNKFSFQINLHIFKYLSPSRSEHRFIFNKKFAIAAKDSSRWRVQVTGGRW